MKPPRIFLALALLLNYSITVQLSAQTGDALAAHGLFQSHMVLQKGQSLPVWGTGTDGEVVTVSINGQSATGTVSGGKWKAVLAPMGYGGPYTMTIQGASKTITLTDVYVGEVWLCSGQSNMEWTMRQAEWPAVDHPLVRSIRIARSNGHVPVPRSGIIGGTWQVAKKSTPAGYFSAVGYHFARTLSESLNVAVGVINSSWGGSTIEAWTSLSMQQAVPELEKVVPYWEGKESDYRYPANLYNGMIHPLAPFAIRGVCWYQGESLPAHGALYRDQLPAMIKDWRNLWRAPDMPFNIVQLPAYGTPQTAPDSGIGGWKAVQEAQLLAMRHLKNVGLAVIIDSEDPTNLHPPNKQPVGYRLGLWALANTYGRSIAYSGPLYKSMRIEGNSIRLGFDHANGMMARAGGALTGFAICGADKKFVWGNARIEGNEIVVSSPSVTSPTIVRYAWATSPLFSLFNRDGLPDSPFRTDCPTALLSGLPSWETRDTQAPTVPTSLKGSVASCTSVNLTWNASSDPSTGSGQAPVNSSGAPSGVVGYLIYRNGVEVGYSRTTSFRDTGLSAETAYTYRVAAYDGAGNQSGQSTQVTATTLPASANRAPVLAPIGKRRVTAGEPLQFTVEASDADGDVLQYSATGGQ